MTIESATYISDLNTANPGAGDPKSEGDDHLRLLKSTIKATFPNINAAMTATDETLNALPATPNGAYTPTTYATTNCTTPTSGDAFWMRNGDIVMVSGIAGATASGAGAVIIDVELPVASNLTTGKLSGALNPVSNASNASLGFVSMNATTDRGSISFTAAAAGVYTFKFVFIYQVI